VSMGMAVYPEDGTTIDALFQAADRALYKMKERYKSA
jgi:GGDEF domain-containing protein